MDLPNAFLAALALVVLIWSGLSIWRDVAWKRWQKIERNYLTYYASRQNDSLEAVPPVIWDFEAERLAEIPPEDYRIERHETGEPGLDVMLVKERSASMPFWTLGVLLSRISAVWFHGIFGSLTLLLAFFAVRGKG